MLFYSFEQLRKMIILKSFKGNPDLLPKFNKELEIPLSRHKSSVTIYCGLPGQELYFSNICNGQLILVITASEKIKCGQEFSGLIWKFENLRSRNQLSIF